MKRSTLIRTVAVGAACALTGSAAGIAESSASSTTHKTNTSHRAAKSSVLKGGLIVHRTFVGPLAKGFAVPALTPGGPVLPVHSEEVLPNEKGGFETVTMDSGTFASLSGQQLTINEGTRKATYKTVMLTVSSDAMVYRNGEKASLPDIKPGDVVSVVQSSTGTVVSAFDEQHEPKLGAKMMRTGPGKAMGVESSGESEGPPPPSARLIPAPPGGPGRLRSTEGGEEGPSS